MLTCFLIFLFFCIQSEAQILDTTKTAIIKSEKQKEIIRQQFDDQQRQFTLNSDAVSLLELNSNAYVRNYGLSNLSTLSIRGSSVAQTNVLWNDIPIQNTMLGLTDLSTVPNFFFDKLALYPSGFNEMGKVQSVGGRLELNNKSYFSSKKSLRLGGLLGYESFGNQVLGVKATYSSPKWSAQLKYYNRQGQNRYTFNNRYEGTLDTIRNSFAVQEQVMVELGWRPNLLHEFKFSFWKIKGFREISPLAFGDNEQRAERNRVTRFGLQHRFVRQKIRWKTSIGLTSDSFYYEDGQIDLQSAARVANIPINTNLSYSVNKKSSLGLSLQQQFSFYNQLNTRRELHQGGLQLFYNHSNIWKGIGVKSFLQQQFTSRAFNPFTYGIKLDKQFKNHVETYASFNANFRMPTLNELYYFPGGNENLLPEKSRNAELGLRANFSLKKFNIENRLSLYSRWVDDWIIWTGAAIFFPDNIAEVWSRGVENNVSIHYDYQKVSFRNDFMFSLNRSSSERSYFFNDQSVGKQIPYVPRLSWRNNFYASYKNWTNQVHLGYTGYRFVTRDESEFVDPYVLLNFYTSYKIGLPKDYELELQLALNNLLGENYESVRGRIMPRRNLAISLLFQ